MHQMVEDGAFVWCHALSHIFIFSFNIDFLSRFTLL